MNKYSSPEWKKQWTDGEGIDVASNNAAGKHKIEVDEVCYASDGEAIKYIVIDGRKYAATNDDDPRSLIPSTEAEEVVQGSLAEVLVWACTYDYGRKGLLGAEIVLDGKKMTDFSYEVSRNGKRELNFYSD